MLEIFVIIYELKFLYPRMYITQYTLFPFIDLVEPEIGITFYGTASFYDFDYQ